MAVRISATPDQAGWRFLVTRVKKFSLGNTRSLPFAQWPEAASGHPGVAALLVLVDAEEAHSDGESVRLSHERVARLSRVEADRIGLPPAAPFTLFLSHDVPIGDPHFSLRVEWFERHGAPVFGLRRTGTWLQVASRAYLILDPLYSALDTIEAVNAASGDPSPAGLDRRMTAYARFKDHLVRLTGDVRADEYLRGLTIHHATGLGIDLESGSDTVPFLPTLYGDRLVDTVTAENEDVEVVREPLLPQLYAEQFQRRFRQQGARRHFILGNGVYTVLDAPVAAALEVVERLNRADADTRKAFREDPMSFLTPAIKQAGGGGGILCDLRGYGERVVGVGPWEPPRLSFRLHITREWYPTEDTEVFTIEIPGEAPLVVRAEEINSLHQAIEQARRADSGSCEHNGRTLALTEDFAKTIQALNGCIAPVPRRPSSESTSDEQKEPGTVALTKDNEELLTFLARQRQRRGGLRPGIAMSIRTQPKPHQVEGVQWLQAAFLAGAPGLLLADDMGLGKTFQVLAFLRWLQEDAEAGNRRDRKPVLVVAPKTLLGNWQEELVTHLGAGALGIELNAFGSDLNALRVIAGNDRENSGAHTLDWSCIESADFVLTTYETLRDYQLSFAKARFSVIVYDEAQKLKNPAALMNRGAKAQQGDFTLMVTGTPIENSVMDLWTLLDIAWPGFLGFSGKEFLKRYGNDDPATREELKRLLVEPSKLSEGTSIPPIMLRRFKQDALDGLPTREVATTQEPMPAPQQAAYDAVLREIHDKSKSALEALQHLRAVSLHPNLAQPIETPGQREEFIAASARFKVLFRILDRIYQQREKALIFVELRDAQQALYELIRHRYPIPPPRPDTINGSTAAAVRDRIRREFQARRGFDVLILGPKAAGFGLTLTAANHVIHLNRWWNPAVEDQCSDRVYRIGAEKPVTIYLPLAIHPRLGERSFDGVLHELLEGKRALSREIVVPVQFSDQDFRRLFDKSVGSDDHSATDSLNHVDRMDWRSFELWVADQLKRAGFRVQVGPGMRDGGADVIALRPDGTGRQVLVQCKHGGSGASITKDESAVFELLRAKENHRSRSDVILAAATNGKFSLAAENLAQEHGIQLFDRSRLTRIGQILARQCGQPC